MTRTRKSAIRAEAIRAAWPTPIWPPAEAPAEALREWNRLYRRLRWALRTQVDVASNVRPGAKLARLRLAAKQRGLKVDLTLQDYEGLIETGRCHYCDAALPATGHGIDRKDSSIGYRLENVVLACDACNRIKSDLFSYEQMMEIGRLLQQWRAEGSWKDPQRKDSRRFGGRPLKGDLRCEIEEWNRRWAAASGTDGSSSSTGTFGDDHGGSGVVREGQDAYAVEGTWSQHPDKVDDLATLSMHRAAVVGGLLADRALGAPSAA
jgi:hypothetical protein